MEHSQKPWWWIRQRFWWLMHTDTMQHPSELRLLDTCYPLGSAAVVAVRPRDPGKRSPNTARRPGPKRAKVKMVLAHPAGGKMDQWQKLISLTWGSDMRENRISEMELVGKARRAREAERHLGMRTNEGGAETQIGLIRFRWTEGHMMERWKQCSYVRWFTAESESRPCLILAEIREAFKVLDRDGNGFISKQELGMAMRSLGYMPSEVELAIIMQRLDMDGESHARPQMQKCSIQCGSAQSVTGCTAIKKTKPLCHKHVNALPCTVSSEKRFTVNDDCSLSCLFVSSHSQWLLNTSVSSFTLFVEQFCHLRPVLAFCLPTESLSGTNAQQIPVSWRPCEQGQVSATDWHFIERIDGERRNMQMQDYR